MQTLRVILFEDNKEYTESLRMFFEDSEKVFLTASFLDATEALKQIRKHEPDVVLMDIELPGVSGIEAMQKIKEAIPDTKILIQTSFEDNHKILAALCGGASGYFIKSAGLMALEQSILDVYQSGGSLSPSIAKKVIALMETNNKVEYVKLTPKEKEVLQYLVEGLSYKMIEAKMDTSYHAVHFHIKNIYTKLHVHSKAEAIVKAIKNKLI